MDIFRDISAEQDESHPTQLVHGVLGLGTQSLDDGSNASTGNARHALEEATYLDDISSGPPILLANAPAHRYQHYGVTSQTQAIEETMLIEPSSQKENTPMASEYPYRAQTQEDHCHRLSAPTGFLVKPGSKNAGSRNDFPACRNTPAADTEMLPAQYSLNKSASSSPTHAMTSRPDQELPQSPSFRLENSMDGVVSQDPVQQPLSSAKRAHAPLPDFDHNSTQSIEEEPSEKTRDSINEGYSFIHAAMNAYTERKVEEALANGSNLSILVPATPSFNEDSHCQSRVLQQQQLSGQATAGNGALYSGYLDYNEEATQPFDLDQGNSSLERSLDRIIASQAAKKSQHPIIPPELESTQSDATTQPNDLSQSVFGEPARAGVRSDIPSDLRLIDDDISVPGQGRNPGRGLLVNANPYKKRKIEYLRREIKENNITFSPPLFNIHVLSSNPVMETQPSVSPFAQNAKISEAGDSVKRTAPRQFPVQYSPLHHDLDDEDDFVPDSEPQQAGLKSPSPQDARQTRPKTSNERGPSPLPGDQPQSSVAKTDLEQTSDEDDASPLVKPGRSHLVKRMARSIPNKSGAKSKQNPRSRQTPRVAARRKAIARKHTSTLDAKKLETETGTILVEDDKESNEDVEDTMDVNGSETSRNAESLEPPRKRLRSAETSSGRKVSRASIRSIKQSSTPGLIPPSTRRLQSLASSSRAHMDDATRVFALWRQDGHYYSGRVYDTSGNGRYVVKFDDQTEDTVDISKMRRCELRVGDDVIFASKNSSRVKVENVDQILATGLVQVKSREGTLSQVAVTDVKLSDIMIASRSISNHWKDRVLSPSDIVAAVRRANYSEASPSPSRSLSVRSTPTILSSRLLAKTGFVITTSRVSKNPDKEKEHIIRAIKRHGGMLIDEWSNIFTMEGSHEVAGKRWFATQEHLRWKGSGDNDIERVFLLSDDASQKSKYLLALALGIPCLSFDWLLGETLPSDWQPYLLPAGFSDVLDARVSQMIDLDWGNSPEYLSDIMTNNVAAKVFKGKDILCLDQAFVQSKAKKRNQDVEKSLEASRSVPWIVLAMGARRVETASDPRQLPKGELQFDYIILKDLEKTHFDLGDREGDFKVVDVPWVKDCLITGRILPISTSK